MMVFQISGIEPLDCVVNIRLNRSEKALLIEDANTAALSMSALVRSRYFGRPIVASADAAVIRELRRLVGLLQNVHIDSRGAYTLETQAAIQALKECMERMGHQK